MPYEHVSAHTDHGQLIFYVIHLFRSSMSTQHVLPTKFPKWSTAENELRVVIDTHYLMINVFARSTPGSYCPTRSGIKWQSAAAGGRISLLVPSVMEPLCLSPSYCLMQLSLHLACVCSLTLHDGPSHSLVRSLMLLYIQLDSIWYGLCIRPRSAQHDFPILN